MKQPILLLFASALALSACNAQKGNNAGKPGTELGIIPEWMDKTAIPGDDFYAYADGSWQKNTPIPADRSNIGRLTGPVGLPKYPALSALRGGFCSTWTYVKHCQRRPPTSVKGLMLRG